jgi:hypothetical protein
VLVAGGPYRQVDQSCRTTDGYVAVAVTMIMIMWVVLLEHLEQKKAGPLTEDEVISARDAQPAVAMEIADFLQLSRGPDLDPHDLWRSWRTYKRSGVLNHPEWITARRH